MNKFRFTIKVLAIAIFTFAFASLAQAQASRTWVSGVGDDVNPCSRTAPCKTFAGAISKTAAGGEIDALDPGGFGAVTITKSLTIDGTHGSGFGSILASSTNGVTVTDASTGTPGTIIVTLRGLSINGGPPNLPGLNGIRFLAGKVLNVEDCKIFNFTQNGGIDVNSSTSALINVSDTSIFNNVRGIRLTTSAGFVNANIFNCQIKSNANEGIRLEANGFANVDNSNIGANATRVSCNGGAVNLTHDQLSGNATGLAAGSSTSRIGGCTFFGNTTAVSIAGGAVKSTGDNYIDGPITGGGLTPLPPV
jgi:hypothetical protein